MDFIPAKAHWPQAPTPGSDADFAILDPTLWTVIENSQQLSKADYTTMQRRAISSRIESVYLRGKRVAEHGRTAGAPAGRYVERSKI